MAHRLNDALNEIAGKTPKPCDDKCEYFRFPHLVVACELSSVFSVAKGQPCYEYKLRRKCGPIADKDGLFELIVRSCETGNILGTVSVAGLQPQELISFEIVEGGFSRD